MKLAKIVKINISFNQLTPLIHCTLQLDNTVIQGTITQLQSIQIVGSRTSQSNNPEIK